MWFTLSRQVKKTGLFEMTRFLYFSKASKLKKEGVAYGTSNSFYDAFDTTDIITDFVISVNFIEYMYSLFVIYKRIIDNIDELFFNLS